MIKFLLQSIQIAFIISLSLAAITTMIIVFLQIPYFGTVIMLFIGLSVLVVLTKLFLIFTERSLGTGPKCNPYPWEKEK